MSTNAQSLSGLNYPFIGIRWEIGKNQKQMEEWIMLECLL